MAHFGAAAKAPTVRRFCRMTAQSRSPLPNWLLWLLAATGTIGAYFGLSGVVMTGSFAVAAPQREAEYLRAQQWWLAILALSAATLVLVGIALVRRHRSRRTVAPRVGTA